METNLNLMVFIQGTLYINLDEFKSAGTHWIILHVNGNSIIYFDS